MPSQHVAAPSRILLRALVADGHTPVNDGLTAMLSDMEGIAIFGCAQEPTKVLELVETVRPGVVILDVEIPGPIGLRTLRALKRLEPAPVVIVLSHYDLPPLRQACKEAGTDYFLEKTGAPARLREVLAEILERCHWPPRPAR